jgi:hypothetical protein
MGAKVFKANGYFLGAEEGHIHGHTERTHKTTFHIEEHDGGAKVSLKTHNGHYVAVNGNNEVYTSHTHHTDEAKFHLEHHGGRVALKSHHGGYLTIQQDGHVHVHHERTEGAMFEELSA